MSESMRRVTRRLETYFAKKKRGTECLLLFSTAIANETNYSIRRNCTNSPVAQKNRKCIRQTVEWRSVDSFRETDSRKLLRERKRDGDVNPQARVSFVNDRMNKH